MKKDVAFEKIEQIVQSLAQGDGRWDNTMVGNVTDRLTRSLMGVPEETPQEISKLRSALRYLSADSARGSGRFFTHDGHVNNEYWLAAVWAVRWLGWKCGFEIIFEWSSTISRCAFDENGVRQAWDSYNPNHPNPVTIASLYKAASMLGWKPRADDVEADTTSAEVHTSESRYRLLSADEILAMQPMSWSLKGIYPRVGLGAIFGQSGSGKSFLALDLAASLCTGTDWFGIKTNQCPVTYLILEGEAGIRNRISAWQKANSLLFPTSCRFVIQPFALVSLSNLDGLIGAIPRDGMVFIDTLNRSAPMADENSSKDMGLILEGMKLISRETSSLVVVVHHSGKDVQRGMRGHSSLFAALDGVIEVTSDSTGRRSWSVSKSKDGDDTISRSFRLNVQNLGVDDDGDPITSCSVELDCSAVIAPRLPSGRAQRPALAAVRGLIKTSAVFGKCQIDMAIPCVSVADAVDVVVETLATTPKNKRRNRANQLITELVNHGYLRSGLDGDEGWVWED
jgi:hypothetical protein